METKSRTGTSLVDVHAYEASPEQTVYLIGTPGFDDTDKSDKKQQKWNKEREEVQPIMAAAKHQRD